MNYTQKQIETQFDLLPEVVQDKLFARELERTVQKIGMEAGLLIDQLKKLNALVNYTILGLLSEKEFEVECKQVFSLDENTSKKLSESISREIIIPTEDLRTSAILEQRRKEEEDRELFEEEKQPESLEPVSEGLPVQNIETGNEAIETEESPVTIPSTPARVWEKEADVAPDNLPIAEDESVDSRLGHPESFLPPISSKTPTLDSETKNWQEAWTPREEKLAAAHPFEEKMKKVFTAGQQSIDSLTLETPTPQSPTTPRAPEPPRTPSTDPYREPIE